MRVIAAEVETSTPLSACLAAGKPTAAVYRPSFVDGIGGKSVLAEMWPLVRDLLDGARAVTLEQVAEAIRLLGERNQVVAEGAVAAAVAVATHHDLAAKRIVCVVSGGNIDPPKLAAILRGELPETG